jgi:peptidoglycan/LPS O-acetylase OafA/YrhL
MNAMTDHFWSLSVEEQFYLAWPLTLWLCGRKKSVWVAIALIIAIAMLRLHAWTYYDQMLRYLHTEVRADALLIGCLASLLLRNRQLTLWLERHGAALFFAALLPFLWDLVHFQRLIPLSESLLIAAMILGTSLAPASVPARVLEYKHLSFLGLISYSLYVWQQLFLVPHWGKFATPMMAMLPLAAIGSYGLVERPCIRMERWLEKQVFSTHPLSSAHRAACPQPDPSESVV